MVDNVRRECIMSMYEIYPLSRKLVFDTFDKKKYDITRTQQIIMLSLCIEGTLTMSQLASKINTSNEEKENAQPAEKVYSDVHTTLKSKRSAALILLTGATLMLIMVFILFWLIMLPNLPQDNSVLANNCANICQTAKEYIGI